MSCTYGALNMAAQEVLTTVILYLKKVLLRLSQTFNGLKLRDILRTITITFAKLRF